MGVQADAPAPLRFIGSAEAELLCPSSVSDEALAEKKQAVRERRVESRRGKAKGRRGVCLLDGTRMPEGWIARAALMTLANGCLISRDLAQMLKVDKQQVECSMSYLLIKMQVS